MNRERERMRRALTEFGAALHRLESQSRAERVRLRANRLSFLVGGGFAAGFVAALFPLRAWPRFAANLVRVGSGLARLPVAPALLAAASKRLLRKATAGGSTRAE